MPHTGNLQIAKRGCVVAVSLICLVGVYKLSEAIYYTNVLGQRLESEFSFQLDTPYLHFGENGVGREVAKLIYVASEGKLGRHGFRSGDVLAELHPHQFYRKLHQAKRGHKIRIVVLRGSTEQPLEQHERHELDLARDFGPEKRGTRQRGHNEVIGGATCLIP